MESKSQRMIVIALIATLALPVVVAHGAEPAAAGFALGDSYLFVPFASNAAEGASTLVADASRPDVRAWHDGAFLHVRSMTPGDGWALLVVDEHAPREVEMQSMDMVFTMYLGALVTGGDGNLAEPVSLARGGTAPAPTAGAGESAHADHGSSSTASGDEEKVEGLIQRLPTNDVITSTYRANGVTITEIAIPESMLGDGLEARAFYDIVVAWSPNPTPPTFFLGERPHSVKVLRAYIAAPGEDAATFSNLVAALNDEGPYTLGFALVGVIASALLGVVVLLARRGELAPRGHGNSEFADALAEAFARPDVRRGRRTARATFTLVVTALFLLPALAPVTSAQFIAGPLPPRAPMELGACSSGMPVRQYNVTAIEVTIFANRFGDNDPQGNMYVLSENVNAVRAEEARMKAFFATGVGEFPTGANESLIVPLVLRAHEGDCVEVNFTNALNPFPSFPALPVDVHPVVPVHAVTGVSEIEPVPDIMPSHVKRRSSMHIHGLPLSPISSEGSTTGLNPDSTVGIGENITYRVRATTEGLYFFHDHGDPSAFGQNSLRGLSDGFRGGSTHGLFGGIAVEPIGSAWTHPTTGAMVKDGWKADILLANGKSFREFIVFYHDPQLVGLDLGPIPELMADHGLNYRAETFSRRVFENDARCPDFDGVENHGVNPCQDPALVYSSFVHGDPGTPIIRAYMRDPVKIRLAHAGSEETHAHHLHNHRWQAVEGNPDSTTIDSQSLSPGETWTQSVNMGAGGEADAKGPGDAIFHCHLFPHLYGGMWGIFRTHDRLEPDLRPLPGLPAPANKSAGFPGFPSFVINAQYADLGETFNVTEGHSLGNVVSNFTGHRAPRPPQIAGLDPRSGIFAPAPGAPYADPCPVGVPERKYHLVGMASQVALNKHGDTMAGAMYALAEDEAAIKAGLKKAEPVVLRFAEGECLIVKLENHLPEFEGDLRVGLGGGKLSIHPHLMSFDILGTDGLVTGWNYDTGIWQGETIYYRYYADYEAQTAVWHDHTAGISGVLRGLLGSTLIEPRDASWRNPKTGGPIYTRGADLSTEYLDSTMNPATGNFSQMWEADITGDAFADFREFFLTIQDFLPAVNRSGVAYRPQLGVNDFADFGLMGFNYRTEPLFHRLSGGPSKYFDSASHGDPGTPLFEAYPGDPVVFRIDQIPFEEAHGVTLQGHRWKFGYKDPTTRIVDTFAIGVSEAFNAYLEGGAGGPNRVPGDYLYRDASTDAMFTGAWGIFRVHDGPRSSLLPLPDARDPVALKTAAKDTPCPKTAPVAKFDITALQRPIVYNAYGDHDSQGMMYVMDHHVDEVKRGLEVDPARNERTRNPEPLTLRVEEGSCVKLRLTNGLPEWTLSNFHAKPQPTGGSSLFNSSALSTGELLNTTHSVFPVIGNRTGIFAHLLLHDVRDSGGVKVGWNPDSTIGPGEKKTYTFYADTVGIDLAFIEDMADPLTHKGHGLFGGIVVIPKGAKVTNPIDGHRESHDPVVDITLPNGYAWRDVTLYPRDGVPLTTAHGRPVPMRDVAVLDTVDATQAAQRALFAMKAFLGDGADARAKLELVRPVELGWVVRGSVDGWHIRAVIDSTDGQLLDFEADHDARALDGGGILKFSRDDGSPVSGERFRLSKNGKTLAEAVTDATGVASFPGIHERGNRFELEMLPSRAKFDVRTDSEGRFAVNIRGDPKAAANIASAAAAMVGVLSDSFLVAGAMGIRSVDATDGVWRVGVEDTLAYYHVELDARTKAVKAFSMKSQAQLVATPSFLTHDVLERVARAYLLEHFGEKKLEVIEFFRDRFGVMRFEIDSPKFANTITIDGASGRVLELLRAPASNVPVLPISGASDTTFRFREEGGGRTDGTLVSFYRNGTLVGSALAQGQGRTPVDPVILQGPVRPTDVTVVIPRWNLQFPWNVAPRVQVYSQLDGLATDATISPAVAIATATTFLAAHAPSVAEPGTGFLPRGLTSLNRFSDGWHVVFGNDEHIVDIVVDDATGAIDSFRARAWAEKIDNCSGQPVEHFGPHGGAACPWSFTILDEEDQGIKGVNYASEPYQWRAYRQPDLAYTYSTPVHGEPWTPLPRAYVGDPVRFHLASAMTKPRAESWMLSGHSWLQEPGDPSSAMRIAEGGITPGRVFRIDVVAGGEKVGGYAGDYLYQGTIQRHQAEMGAWGIFRVYDEPEPGLRPLSKVRAPVSPGGDGATVPPFGGPISAGSCAPPLFATIARGLFLDADGLWTLSAQPDGILVSPRGNESRILLTLNVGSPDAPRVEIEATARDGWTANVTRLAGGTNTSQKFCVNVKGGALVTVLKIDFTFKVKNVDGTDRAILHASLPFLAQSASDAGAPESDASRPTPGPGWVAVLAAVGVGLVLLGKRRRGGRDGVSSPAGNSARTYATGVVLVLASLIAIMGLLSIAENVSAASVSVSVLDKSFRPARLEIAPGDTVTWRNTGDRPHTVTSFASGGFSSGNMNAGAEFSHTFPDVGSFSYRCVYHGEMVASVIVKDQAAPPPAEPTPTPPPADPTPAQSPTGDPTPTPPPADPAPTPPTSAEPPANDSSPTNEPPVSEPQPVSLANVSFALASPDFSKPLAGVVEVRGTVAGLPSDARVQVQVDAAPWRDVGNKSPWTFTWDTRALADGAHILAIRAVSNTESSAVLWQNARVANAAAGNAPAAADLDRSTPAVSLPMIVLATVIAACVLVRPGEGSR